MCKTFIQSHFQQLEKKKIKVINTENFTPTFGSPNDKNMTILSRLDKIILRLRWCTITPFIEKDYKNLEALSSVISELENTETNKNQLFLNNGYVEFN